MSLSPPYCIQQSSPMVERTRRHALTIVGVLAIAATLSQASWAQDALARVDARIGTGNGGNTFPGATLPFGMIQWSPDTGNNGWYLDGEKRIHGFSLTHLSGAGCPVFADMPILPWATQPAADRGDALESTAFDRTTEAVHPGSYAVTLEDGTSVELAVTARAGMARLRFPAGAHAGLLVNGSGSANSDVHMAKLPPVGREQDMESLAVLPDGTIAGSVTAGGFCGTPTQYTLYVAYALRQPPVRTVLWQDGKVMDGPSGRKQAAQGKHASAWLDLGQGGEYRIKVGLSYVSQAGAEANLRTEMPGWDFDAVKKNAEAAWSKALGAIQVDTPNTADSTIFYTAFYHNLVAPNLFSDADGSYMGFDRKPHQVAPGQGAQYTNFSDWDTYRDTTPLQAWLLPQVASDMAQSLVNDAVQMGSLPRWAIANDSSYVMGGDSPSILLAEYHSFGATRFDTAAALHAMVRGATTPGLGVHGAEQREHVADYVKLGYLPATTNADTWDLSASQTLEDANADFAISRFAAALGDTEAARRMKNNAGNWRNLLDPETRWIRPRYADGTWLKGFDPELSLPHTVNAPVPTDQFGFQEGNTYQYTFMLPFDYQGLFDAIGDKNVVEQRLDKFFKKLVCWGEPCFNMANEPDFVTPYAYTFLGKPWKTAEVVTRVEQEVFNTSPGGIPGNDDLGATSGVYVWNALGLYPAEPGLGGWVLGTPRFPHARIRTASGQTLRIDREGTGIYVQSVRFNGRPWLSTWLPLKDLQAGDNVLSFTMSDHSGSAWGTAPADRPPSLSAPLVSPGPGTLPGKSGR